jgi:hypothetical protein
MLGKDCFYKDHIISNVPKYNNLDSLIEQIYFGKKAIEMYFN